MNQNNCIIRLEKPEDHPKTEALVREAFWNTYRPGCLEHYVLHCLRNDPDFIPELDLVMEIDDKIIGQIIFMKAAVITEQDETIPILTAGPLCISPEYQRQGLGKKLLEYGLSNAKKLGFGAICFEGNYDFYGKCGFVLAGTKGIRYHAEPEVEIVPYLMLKELVPGYLKNINGIYYTPEGYFVNEAEAERFDQQFPPKVKLKLPGQLVS